MKATGHDWAAWLKILDKAGAKKMSHQEITEVASRNGAGMWWSQMVTVTYEQKRGLREVHQQSDGFTSNVSRTVAAPLDALYSAFAKWLKKQKATVRKANANKSMRITWPDDTSVEANFYAKGDEKSSVAVQHSKLASAAAVKEKKTYWAGVLDGLKKDVES